jgi:hypothetical protein
VLNIPISISSMKNGHIYCVASKLLFLVMARDGRPMTSGGYSKI